MKTVYLIIFFSIFNIAFCFGQINQQRFRNIVESKQLSQTELKINLARYDFSKLFTQTDNSVVYGFIGNKYNRLRIKIITIIKDHSNPDIYNVYGKSLVNDNINEFDGYIKIAKILKLKVTEHGCEDDSLFKGHKGEFSIEGNYFFAENAKQNHSGVFKGSFRSDYFVDKNNHIKYDNIEDCSDGYTNNQFIGRWISNKTKTAKTCNWGDYRMPNSGNFDIGAGEFSPNTNDPKLGWQTIHDMWLTDKKGNLSPKAKLAKQIEEAKWWK